ncbi:MAG: transporter, partial [Ferruginibacter sp.]
MQLDRPDVTESAYSVEAGHFQVESDLFKMVRNKSEDLSHTEMGYNVANLKLGLTERLDVQLVVATFVSRKTKEITSNKIIHKANGFDDITLRFKYNFWGNEGGKTALGALPYISFPTSTIDDNDHQFGVIFPFALELN